MILDGFYCATNAFVREQFSLEKWVEYANVFFRYVAENKTLR